MNQAIGQTIGGHYQIVSSLGGGGFGQTYLAQDKYLPGEPLCVVKQLKPLTSDPQSLQTARRLFDNEAKVLYQLGNHEQIPRLFAYFEENQEFYLVQEFIEGHDLNQELTSKSPSSSSVHGGWGDEEQVISLLQDILEVLEFVHEQNVVHRDINPRNLIRRDKDSKLILIDFGAVKQISTQLINSQKQTGFSISIGTPGYMPSEQANGTPRLSSDIYAVGMIGIQSLTGLAPNQLPEDPDTGEILWCTQAVGSTQNSPLRDVLDKMVRYDFRQRYRSASEALQAVKELRTATHATVAVPVVKSSNSLVIKPRIFPLKNWKVLTVVGLIGFGGAATVCIVNIINSTNAIGSYRQGKTLYDLKRYEEALALYKQATQSRPNYIEAWNGQGNTLLQLKKSKEALNVYDQAIQFESNNLEAWIGRGIALNNLQRYEEAIDSFDKALTLQPNAPEAWNGKGDALLNLQRYEPAVVVYDKVVKLKPDYYQAWYSRGWALHNLKRFQEAIASYDKAIEVQPDSYQSWGNRGNALISLQQYREAVESYDKAVQYKPDYYQAWYSRGNALINLQQYKDAIESFNKAVKYQPDAYEAWYSRGWAFHQLQRYEEALTSYNQAIQFKRNDYQTWYNRGNALYNLKRYQEAIASYDKAVRYKPDDSDVWYSRGDALYNLKRYQEAIASYDKAVRYNPGFQQAIEAKKRVQEAQMKPENPVSPAQVLPGNGGREAPVPSPTGGDSYSPIRRRTAI